MDITLSALGDMSISTGLALSAIISTDITDHVDDPPKHPTPNTLIINLHKLGRNILSSMNRTDKARMVIEDKVLELTELLRQEIEAINLLLEPYGIMVLYVAPIYRRPMTDAQLRKLRTKQRETAFIEKCVQMGGYPQTEHAVQTTYVMTDIPYDLIRMRHPILNSHTGTLEGVTSFSKKLNLGSLKHYDVPFNRLTLKLFGDKHGYIQQLTISNRRQLFKIWKEKKFNSQTTMLEIEDAFHDISWYRTLSNTPDTTFC